MDLMAVHASREIASKWSAKLGKMTLRIDELEYGHLSLLGIELGVMGELRELTWFKVPT